MARRSGPIGCRSLKRVDSWLRRSCRICGSNVLVPYLSYGEQPLANRLLSSPEEPCPVYPLSISFCPECGLSQLDQVISPMLLYHKDYFYQSGVSNSWVKHCAELAGELVELENGLVIDIGANDGTFLNQVNRRSKMRLLGIEPCVNYAAKGKNWGGVPTIQNFWGSFVARDTRQLHGRADYIVAQNVLAHVDDLNEFLSSVHSTLRSLPTSRFIFEVPYVKNVLEQVQFDVIYHEHLSYFLVTPLARALSRWGLGVVRVDPLPEMHGGSLRVWCCPEAKDVPEWGKLQVGERAAGLLDQSYYLTFARRVQLVREALLDRLHELGPVVGIGAAAKATVLANFLGLTMKDVLFVVDETPEKQGKWIPGSGIPIVPRSRLDETVWPVKLLVFVWNYLDEVKKRYPGYEYITPWLEVAHAR